MSQKAFGDGHGKTIASKDRKVRFPAVLGLLGAMVRGRPPVQSFNPAPSAGLVNPSTAGVDSRFLH
ncbi:MAG: hypothetical protein R3291_03870 [Thermoplasmata archaeon]|nr:hypothetical protein [Thermoplasmata archaeon]